MRENRDATREPAAGGGLNEPPLGSSRSAGHQSRGPGSRLGMSGTRLRATRAMSRDVLRQPLDVVTRPLDGAPPADCLQYPYPYGPVLRSIALESRPQSALPTRSQSSGRDEATKIDICNLRGSAKRTRLGPGGGPDSRAHECGGGSDWRRPGLFMNSTLAVGSRTDAASPAQCSLNVAVVAHLSVSVGLDVPSFESTATTSVNALTRPRPRCFATVDPASPTGTCTATANRCLSTSFPLSPGSRDGSECRMKEVIGHVPSVSLPAA